MVQNPSDALSTGPYSEGTVSPQQMLRMQAALLVARHMREQLWMTSLAVGLGALLAVSVGKFSVELGYIEISRSFSHNIIPITQFATILIAAVLGVIYIIGRIRMARAEMDLLRLKLEVVSAESETAFEQVDHKKSPSGMLLSGVRRKHRRIKHDPNN